jgi:hypothetical protein
MARRALNETRNTPLSGQEQGRPEADRTGSHDQRRILVVHVILQVQLSTQVALRFQSRYNITSSQNLCQQGRQDKKVNKRVRRQIFDGSWFLLGSLSFFSWRSRRLGGSFLSRQRKQML